MSLAPHLRQLSLLLALGAACAPLWAQPLAKAPTAQDCDGPSSSVLKAAAAKLPTAEGIWLDGIRLQWPGHTAAPGVRWRLAYSHSAGLVAKVGEPLSGADGVLELSIDDSDLPPVTAQRFAYVKPGVRLRVSGRDAMDLAQTWTAQMWLLKEDSQGRILAATATQLPGALDDAYALAESSAELGAIVTPQRSTFRLWAPTAQRVMLCLHPGKPGEGKASVLRPLQREDATGLWTTQLPQDLQGQRYSYLVDVVTPDAGLVRNRVTDPYSVSVTTNSRHSVALRLDHPDTEPAGWDSTPRPQTVAHATDLVVYELHVRDFSRDDPSVPAAHRGKYLGFTHPQSQGMQHLRRLAQAGLTDVHLLPIYDLSTVPETGCVTPATTGPRDGKAQQAAVNASRDADCYNWGYDPFHFNAPEGSYATQPDDGAARVREMRAMVQALHRAGLRAGMDVVYNHTFASGQSEMSVLDRIVPGYYHRLSAAGEIERSTCCENTATEHRMVARLMSDSVLLWAREHHIDSFRFDLMGHQPRSVMEAMRARLKRELGRDIHFIGEGWNFGEVANGSRFVQASQLSLNGSGIGSFNDRMRDAARGGSAGDSGAALLARQGWLNGQLTDPNAQAAPATAADLARAADLIRLGLAGTLRDVRFTTADGGTKRGAEIDYGGQPAGFASQPAEVVNYVENHDNQTLFDTNAMKLPTSTSPQERARVQVLGNALVAFSQGVAYFHAGQELMRSKSLDRNSYNSGDAFNRLDFSATTNHFGSGLPPERDNGKDWPLMQPLLANAQINPRPEDIRFARDATLDLLRIRDSSALFRLRSSAEVQQRLSFLNTGPQQNPAVIVTLLNGQGLKDANFASILVVLNTDKQAQRLSLPALGGKRWALHPVHLAPAAADKRVREASLDGTTGELLVPGRTAVVWVVR
ncbi:MAG: alpha-1,6-glucosidase domain-containing protein [Ideonella sp.]|nr:alpha-1,6-glucosidase domain-containing protein [Ideonella sp.]